MFKVIILPEANADIKEAAGWYNDRQRRLGKRFTKHLRAKVKTIQRNPKSNRIRYDNVRTAVLNVFPFMIHYLIDEKNKIIIVTAVLHTSRNPDLWNKRK